MLCQECSKRNTCIELCEEAEVYADQDNIDWQETPVSIYTQGEELRIFNSDTEVDKPFLTLREKDVLSRLANGLTRDEIAKDLNVSRVYLRKIIERMRKKACQLLA